ncbi:hypothetical protein Ddye_026768 [Dipteronia dyeriana]|uniref:RNase H type-1 domain-containing protein n=1 Tax=Dipteronia dyeriana TaxID=168575 RepID=A0AAD9WQS6_9ROSI|nr:hypothetical protein Ddye_026768 [Dipteronia dyeriana]
MGGGKVLAVRVSSLLGVFSAEISHLITLQEGLLFAKLYNFSISLVEISSSRVASLLLGSVMLLRDSFPIINDIKVLLFETGFCKCQASPLSGNSLAHNLALSAFSCVRERLWLDTSSSSVFPFV